MSLWGWLIRRRRKEELDEEIRCHLRMAAQERIERGESAEQARSAALREFGNVALVKEVTRDLWGWRWLETLLQDIRYGARQLRRNPGFSAVAILTLGLGIGANTAVFSLINAVMLKTLPVKHPENLLSLDWAAHADRPLATMHWRDGSSSRNGGVEISDSFSFRTFEEVRARNQAFSDFFAFKDLGEVNVVIKGQAGRASGQLVSGGYFSGLGVPAILGRTITESDDRPSAAPVLVLSYNYWMGKFGGETGVVGKSITVNGVPFTVIGVTPPEFFGLTAGSLVELSMPLRTEPLVEPRWVPPNISLFTAPDHWWLNLMGRLKPGISEQQARAGLDVIFRQSILEGVAFKPGEGTDVPWLVEQHATRGLDSLRQEFSQPLFVLMTLVGLVLVTACANVANLLLARAVARRREMGVRYALGAGRSRLIRQLLTESILLAAAGGLLGLIIAYWGASSLLAFMSTRGDPILLDVHPDLKVFAFAAAVSLVTGLCFGIAPAFRETRFGLTSLLKSALGGWGSGVVRVSLMKALLISQVAVSFVLLVGAGLFVRTLVNLEHVNLGFSQEHLLLFGIDPTQDGYQGTRLADFYTRLQNELEVLPGVRSATLSLHSLLSGHLRTDNIWVPGYTPKPTDEKEVHELPVGTGFFRTMQIPLLLGRDFQRQDDERSRLVAIVNETMARHYFGTGNPVGRHFNWGGSESRDQIEIVGVARDARYTGLRDDAPATIYVPFRQTLDSISSMHFEVRATADPQALVPAVRRVVRGLDTNLPLFDLKTQVEQMDQTLFEERLFAKLSSLFGLLALTLACVGLYGVTAYGVTRRTNEIGIRMALGADPGAVLGMVMGESSVLVVAGIVIGAPVALAASRLISSMLFGLKPSDPVTIAGAAVVMSAVAALAGYLPARSATKVDPMVALRYE